MFAFHTDEDIWFSLEDGPIEMPLAIGDLAGYEPERLALCNDSTYINGMKNCLEPLICGQRISLECWDDFLPHLVENLDTEIVKNGTSKVVVDTFHPDCPCQTWGFDMLNYIAILPSNQERVFPTRAQLVIFPLKCPSLWNMFNEVNIVEV